MILFVVNISRSSFEVYSFAISSHIPVFEALLFGFFLLFVNDTLFVRQVSRGISPCQLKVYGKSSHKRGHGSGVSRGEWRDP